MSRRAARQPKKHSQRVAAWIYAVINPILEGLERELEFVKSGNLTWRYYSQRFEFIRPIQQYVESSQWPNYSDFLVENPDCEDGFRSHDEAIEALNNSASALYSWLLSSPQLTRALSVSVNEYEARRSSDLRLSDLTYMQSDLPKVVAEYLINDVQTLPSHYVVSKFWAIASGNLLDLRTLNNFGPLRQNAQFLKLRSQEVKARLETLRLDFLRKFDLPAAPIPDFLPKR
jgi:hypothetical protein